MGDAIELLIAYHGVLPAQQQRPHVLHGSMERPRDPAQRGEVGWAVVELADELDDIADVPQGSHEHDWRTLRFREPRRDCGTVANADVPQ
jgi:hypothetical protein